MDSLLQTISGPWTSYILWLLSSQGTLRFGELKAKMPGISSKVLTDRPHILESTNLIYRDYKPTIPPSISYSLTARGTELKDVLDGLNVLALRWHAEDTKVEA
jgi:DNA-binding HxlR family transcriptional regulator